MKFAVINYFIATIFFVSCSQSKEVDSSVKADTKDSIAVAPDKCASQLNEAKRLDKVILSTTALNNKVAEEAIKVFYDFSNTCKLDPVAPEYLLKAGQISQSLRKYTQAQSYFIKCVDDFPKYKDRGAALFLLAQLYDNPSMLNDESEARTIYHQILREYPKSSYAVDAQSCINNIGKTDEQLIQEFLKKNK